MRLSLLQLKKTGGLHFIRLPPGLACHMELRQKRPNVPSQDRSLHWDNKLFHTAATFMELATATGVMLIPHLPFLPDIVLNHILSSQT